MARFKLTKSVVDAAVPAAKEFELRDTIVPGFLCKVTPIGRKVFMIQYRPNTGDRRKPSIGWIGEITVEQARSIGRDWLADVRRGNDPSAAKLAAGPVGKGTLRAWHPGLLEAAQQATERPEQPTIHPEPHPARLREN
jgi:hypothetical protein